jgi:hypothetical protein
MIGCHMPLLLRTLAPVPPFPLMELRKTSSDRGRHCHSVPCAAHLVHCCPDKQCRHCGPCAWLLTVRNLRSDSKEHHVPPAVVTVQNKDYPHLLHLVPALDVSGHSFVALVDEEVITPAFAPSHVCTPACLALQVQCTLYACVSQVLGNGLGAQGRGELTRKPRCTVVTGNLHLCRKFNTCCLLV